MPDEPVPEPPEPEPQLEPQPDPEPEPERPMSVQEMCELITELKAKVLNDSAAFTAPKSYQAGDIITDGSRVYIADQVIIKGETVAPGVNCTETTIAEVINQIQQQEGE